MQPLINQCINSPALAGAKKPAGPKSDDPADVAAAALMMTVDGTMDIDAVEHHMQGLLHVVGLDAAAAVALDEDEQLNLRLAKTSLRAHCRAVSEASVDRYRTLQSFVDMLPDRAKKAHAVELLERVYHEPLAKGVLPQVGLGSETKRP